MDQIVRRGLYDTAAEELIGSYCQEQGVNDIDKFTAMTLADPSALHAVAWPA